MKFPTKMESHKIHVPNHQPVIINHESLSLTIIIPYISPMLHPFRTWHLPGFTDVHRTWEANSNSQQRTANLGGIAKAMTHGCLEKFITLSLFNIAMENPLQMEVSMEIIVIYSGFIVDLPIENGDL